MLKGIIVKPLKRANDERGSFTEIMRVDWKELLGEDLPTQANLSTSYPGIIRAWHRHLRGQTDYFIILKGRLKICAYDDKKMELNEITSTGRDLQIVRIPGHYWHGFKVIGDERASIIYFTTKLYEYQNPDEERRPWNDPKIVPQIINGSKTDSRIAKPWDCNYPPH